MARSFQIVEWKVAEADFFLSKLEETTFGHIGFFEARNYLSAFVSSARSITLSVQASLSGVQGFAEWWTLRRDSLRENKLAKYFLEVRNHSQKVGYYPLVSGSTYRDSDNIVRAEYYFEKYPIDIKVETPEEDVLSACKRYLICLLQVVYECYRDFGTVIDPEQYFTFENLTLTGKTIEDFEEELGYPRGWTADGEATDGERLALIRREIAYDGIDHILIKYLGRNRFGEVETH